MDDLIVLLLMALTIAGVTIFSRKLFIYNLKALSIIWLAVALLTLFFLGQYVEKPYWLMGVAAAVSMTSGVVDYYKFLKLPYTRIPCLNWLIIFGVCLVSIGILWSLGMDLGQV